jgi:biopolymer transport protein ExbD
MRRFSNRQSLHTVTELNVTPLLDLAFVLLIIFMITTPLMDNSVDLVVPSSEASQKAVDPSAVQTIAINREELLRLNDRPVTLPELEEALAQLKTERPDVAVVIRAHRELPVQKLIDLTDAVRRAKITKLGVVTNPES